MSIFEGGALRVHEEENTDEGANLASDGEGNQTSDDEIDVQDFNSANTNGEVETHEIVRKKLANYRRD